MRQKFRAAAFEGLKHPLFETHTQNLPLQHHKLFVLKLTVNIDIYVYTYKRITTAGSKNEQK